MPLREVRLAQARAQIAALASAPASSGEVLAFGDARVDGRLPGGGLTLGCWHELAGEGLELETAAAPAAFAACLARPMARRGEIVWVLRRDDLYAPGLAGLGFPAERLIQVCARDEAEALAVIEDALRTPGVWAVFGEAEGVGLVEGRRLQLACERGSAAGFILRRRPYGGRPLRTAGSAAATRWRIAAAPSEPAPGETGLGPPRWRVALERCRGGRTGAWLMEAWEDQDAAHPFRVVAELADRGLAAEAPLRRAG
ncbi:MAG: protein imuA [Caulobacteraceae bacterium]|nr:protein imuA [Caulobacteraceae bacterium]